MGQRGRVGSGNPVDQIRGSSVYWMVGRRRSAVAEQQQGSETEQLRQHFGVEKRLSNGKS